MTFVIDKTKEEAWSPISSLLLITAASLLKRAIMKNTIHQPAANWHFSHSDDISIDQSCMGFDLVNKHVSDGAILRVAPVVSVKWLWRIFRQTWWESACVCFVWDLFLLHSAAALLCQTNYSFVIPQSGLSWQIRSQGNNSASTTTTTKFLIILDDSCTTRVTFTLSLL